MTTMMYFEPEIRNSFEKILEARLEADTNIGLINLSFEPVFDKVTKKDTLLPQDVFATYFPLADMWKIWKEYEHLYEVYTHTEVVYKLREVSIFGQYGYIDVRPFLVEFRQHALELIPKNTRLYWDNPEFGGHCIEIRNDGQKSPERLLGMTNWSWDPSKDEISKFSGDRFGTITDIKLVPESIKDLIIEWCQQNNWQFPAWHAGKDFALLSATTPGWYGDF